MSLLVTWYSSIQEWMMQNIVLPILYAFNGMGFADDAMTGLDWFLLGFIQVLVIALVFKPIEKLIPAEKIAGDPGHQQLTDVFYTLIHRLGVFKLALFLLFSDLFFWFDAQLHDFGFQRLNVESWLPGITSIPLVSFLIYLIIIDFFEYVYHRASHHWNWWWQLHALHHSQQRMTVWTDNRNHVFDDLIHSAFFAVIALMIGVEPIQFLWIIALGQLIQSWQHGNLNLDHGWFGYVLISPKFHRFHHAVGMGHEVEGRPGVLGGCNFGVLFPWWDMLFRTARFSQDIYPTGVRGLTVSNNLIRHQWQGLVHSFKSLLSK
ncbi:sterol desaturase family protein [Polynucleobacter sp. 30F-ANTBAC]|jgi:sterol desaturase/sphingolipid hydroxylase (fatty acid hydroxylase superfamily)|uniref:sterol desaturase family protein n=1 Tax=Polynucleobacter sp. 30F-ANTBAC TaxID=2689095 RepID=UPI001C0D61F7|nr:sterol desaturase family protein [Polynucleobacter sp. 30F-ANTBAC]MBU3599180.1 sterol desaturase family protein [Polynucleobacter sp. 30F-ANTBAC]